MKQKKCIVTLIMVFLHFYLYNMEQSNKIIPFDCFRVECGYLPYTYYNDVWLKNIVYCSLTGKFILPFTYLTERTTCYSAFPSLQLTRAYSSFTAKGDVYRFVDVTEADVAFLRDINTKFIFKDPEKNQK